MSCKPLLCVLLAAVSPPPCKSCFLVCGVRTTIKNNLRPWASCFLAILTTVFLPTNIRAGKRICAFCGVESAAKAIPFWEAKCSFKIIISGEGSSDPSIFQPAWELIRGRSFSGIPIDRRRMGNWLFMLSICLHIRDALQKVSAFPRFRFLIC